MKKVLLAAACAALIATSGLVNVNIDHWTHFPTAYSEVVTKDRGIFSTTYHINMKNEIKDTDSVKNILKVLQTATSRDTVVFHLAGYGGEVDTVADIVNNANASKAHIETRVEAPVYSGHAFLAVLLPNLKVEKYAYLMFHYSSILNFGGCADKEGYDRGVSNVEHCQMFVDAHIHMFNKLLDDSKYLTQEEKLSIMKGHDVYLHSEDIAKRQGILHKLGVK